MSATNLMTINIHIKEGPLTDAIRISQTIPEFEDPYPREEYEHRLQGSPSLVLVAYKASKPVGFKIGYQRDSDGSFYSWMGGVLPEFRIQRIAGRLAEHQESWARSQGYTSIRLKTRNRHRAMLHFALDRGFHIIGFEEKSPWEESRIWLEKPLG